MLLIIPLLTFLMMNTVEPQTPTVPPVRHVLTSVSQNIREETWGLTSRDLRLPGVADWSIRKYTLHGGRQEGVDLIEIDNGRLRIVVSPTRGMSIIRVERGPIRLGWDSPVKEIVHPQFINLASRGGLGWLEGFNEWMVRCGLEWAGHPGKDRFVNNLGEVAEMDLTLHGRIGNIPASEVEVEVDRQPPYRIRLRGRVDERMFYGPKLELWTEITTVPGSPALMIDDRLTNHSSDSQEFELIYHANYGPPLLEEGSRFLGALSEVRPFNQHAARGLAGYGEYRRPTPGFVEEVFLMTPLADADGRTAVQLRNQAADRAVTMAWDTKSLPFFTLWKNTNTPEEGYVTGLEPGTGSPANRNIERQAGRLPKLAAGETRRFHVEVAIQAGHEEVERAAAPIFRLRNGREPRLNASPVKP